MKRRKKVDNDNDDDGKRANKALKYIIVKCM